MSKHYIIIGGSKGIGRALVNEMINRGDQVTVYSRTKGDLDNSINHIVFDATTDEFPKDTLPEEIHGLAYCPGSITLKPFRSLKEETFLEDFNINVLGAVKAVKASMTKLKKSGTGSVVLFSTVAVGQGMAFHASIATAKAAVEGLTRSLAAELAPAIRVNCIAPSLTDTQLAGNLLSTPEKKQASDNRHPLRRTGTATDIAKMAAFLLSNDSTWISGQIIGVDGGMSALRI